MLGRSKLAASSKIGDSKKTLGERNGNPQKSYEFFLFLSGNTFKDGAWNFLYASITHNPG